MRPSKRAGKWISLLPSWCDHSHCPFSSHITSSLLALIYTHTLLMTCFLVLHQVRHKYGLHVIFSIRALMVVLDQIIGYLSYVGLAGASGRLSVLIVMLTYLIGIISLSIMSWKMGKEVSKYMVSS